MIFTQRQRKKRKELPPRYLLLIMTIICVVFIVFGPTAAAGGAGPLSYVAGYVILPMQNGINKIGSGLSGLSLRFVSKQELKEENLALQEEIDSLRAQLNQVETNQHEYEELKALYDTQQTFSSFETMDAEVVAKDPGNWFSTFLIDQGAKDGVRTGMNVIAQGGLVGIVIDVGPNYAKVRSIIDDASSISAMDAETSDLFIVNGNLQTMNQSQMIGFSNLRLPEEGESMVSEGDKVVTSAISDRYLKGIPIGYIAAVTDDEGNLTRSGMILPIVDFTHLEHVLVIMETKDYADIGIGQGN